MSRPRKSPIRSRVVAVLLHAAVTLVPAGAVAATSEPFVMSDGTSGAGNVVGIHATRGVVKSIDPTTLVLARPGHLGEMTFNLTSSTRREGMIVVGAVVSVRYREDGKSHIATAVALQRPVD